MDLDQSILTTIKKMLGLTDSVNAFDDEITAHINAAFLTLSQIGIRPDDDFSISGYDATWRQYVDDTKIIDPVRQFIYLKVRLIFDPPASSVVSDAYNQRLAEVEWRLNVLAEKLADEAAAEGATGT